MNEELYLKLLQVDFQAAMFYEQICKDPEFRPGLFLDTNTSDLVKWCLWSETPQRAGYWHDIHEK